MFNPTHWLVSRSRRIPVILQRQGETVFVFTESEWGKTHSPAFELRSKMGLYCRGIKVVGYELEPMLTKANVSKQAIDA